MHECQAGANDQNFSQSSSPATLLEILASNQTKILQVGLILQLVASQGDQISYANSVVTPFHTYEVPNINILLYYVVVSLNAGLSDL